MNGAIKKRASLSTMKDFSSKSKTLFHNWKEKRKLLQVRFGHNVKPSVARIGLGPGQGPGLDLEFIRGSSDKRNHLPVNTMKEKEEQHTFQNS